MVALVTDFCSQGEAKRYSESLLLKCLSPCALVQGAEFSWLWVQSSSTPKRVRSSKYVGLTWGTENRFQHQFIHASCVK